jgi:hypothetical protein
VHAKGAIARALVALDCQDAALYRAGIRLRQLEPVWGGSVDTAIDLRGTCAMGLVQTRYPRALAELVALLADPEPRARTGAAPAIVCAVPLGAEAVLRAKALMGNARPDCCRWTLRRRRLPGRSRSGGPGPRRPRPGRVALPPGLGAAA